MIGQGVNLKRDPTFLKNFFAISLQGFYLKLLGNVHLLPEGGMGRKVGGLRKLLKIGRGVYEKIWTS